MAISKRDKNFIKLGITAVITFVLALYVLIPFYKSEMEIREKIQLMELTNEKYMKILNQRDKVEKKLNRLIREKSSIGNKLLEGNTTSLAAAKMQKILEKISRASEVELKSVKVRDPEEIEDFISIPVELRFITDLKKTTKFLKGIEQNKKLMIISKFRISARRRRDPKLLTVTLLVKGFMENAEEKVG